MLGELDAPPAPAPAAPRASMTALPLPPAAAAPPAALTFDLAPTPPRPATEAPTHHRRLGLTLALCALALGAAFVLQPNLTDDPEAPRAHPPTQMPAPTAHARRASEGADKAAVPPPARVTPVLSVMSTPPGADVVLGEKFYGKTPLVIESPDLHSLMITLRKPGYQTWTQVVRPSEKTGHFTVRADLAPAR